MTDAKEVIQNDQFSYAIIYQNNNTPFEIHLKHNDQALSIIIMKKCFSKSIAFKETFSFEKLSKLTQPYLSVRNIAEFRNELIKLIKAKLFEIKEANDKMTFSLHIYQSKGNFLNKELILNKFQEDYEKDVSVLLKKLRSLTKNQDTKINQIQTKDNDISNRINALDQSIDLINAFIKEFTVEEKKDQFRNSLPQNYPNHLLANNTHQSKPQPIKDFRKTTTIGSKRGSNINPIDNPQSKNQFRKTLTTCKTVRNLNPVNDQTPITNWISRTRFIKLESIYLGSNCKFSASFFHCRYDNAVPTVTIVTLDNGAIFGGFTCQTWKGEKEDKADKEAFLFSINHNKKYQVRGFQVKNAIHCRLNYIVAFGNPNCFDLLIVDQGNKFECMSEFPYCYGNNEQKYSLTLGKKKFGIKEIEIFQVHYRDY